MGDLQQSVQQIFSPAMDAMDSQDSQRKQSEVLPLVETNSAPASAPEADNNLRKPFTSTTEGLPAESDTQEKIPIGDGTKNAPDFSNTNGIPLPDNTKFPNNLHTYWSTNMRDGNGPNSLRPDTEFGISDQESLPDVNVYQHKKTLAQGMMDIALFSANANQLRYVMESSSRHPYFYPSTIMISLSLILQVAIGVGLIWNSTYNVKDKKEICIANKINNFTVVGIFVVTAINVFICSFGVAGAPPAIAPP